MMLVFVIGFCSTSKQRFLSFFRHAHAAHAEVEGGSCIVPFLVRALSTVDTARSGLGEAGSIVQG